MSMNSTHRLSHGEILVVEDNSSDLKFLSDILTKAGYRVRPANDGELALRSLRAKLPDLILLDVQMPGTIGVEVCRRLKADPNTMDLPVIFISAMGETDLKVRALEAGGIDYVTKPFEPSEVLARINTHLDMHRLQRRLAVQSEELGAEIEDRKKAQQELGKHREHLEELVRERTADLRTANEELSEYARVVSHDLRSPLRAIRQYADFLREDLEGRLEGDQKEYLGGLVESVANADALVRDLLDLSRVGQKAVPAECINMREFLKGISDEFTFPQDVVVEIADDWPAITVEPVVFRMIFQNLISNAEKFNKSSPRTVQLGWRESDADHWEFCVRDNGIGIEARFHEQIFRLFERLHVEDEYEGTGIGLAIVRKAVNYLRGSIRLESRPGEGSAFYVLLPKQPKGAARWPT